MKLSKKSAVLQRAIHKAVASGKALGGLVVGFAATVAGCRDHSPANTMGDYPASPPLQEENAMKSRCRVTPGLPAVPRPAETNAVNEHKRRKANRIMGKTPRAIDEDTSK